MWSLDVSVSVVNYSKDHIHATIDFLKIEQSQWMFTGIYGYLETQNKYLTWELMNLLSNTMGSIKWLVCGDFKEVADQNEKWEGQRKLESEIDAFKEAISQCALQDLRFSGPQFT